MSVFEGYLCYQTFFFFDKVALDVQFFLFEVKIMFRLRDI